MNTEHLQQIFSHYIDRFEYVNNSEHNENYKWYIANEFHQLMDEALGAADSEFAEAAIEEIVSWLKRKDSIERIFKFTEKELQPYTKYLE